MIANTRQVHDLSNLASRNGNSTNTFKLPLTALNKELLGWPEDVNSFSDIPYSRIEALHIIDGQHQSGYLHLDGIEGDFANCVFYSGNSDFFDKLGDKKLNDLKLTDLDTYWNIDGLTPNVFSTKNNTTGVLWPIIEWGADDQNYRTLPVDELRVNPKTLRPAIFTHTLMQKIAIETGYTLIGDFLTDTRYLAEFIPVVENEPKHSDIWNDGQDFTGTMNTPITTNLASGQTGIVTYDLDNTTDLGGNFTSFYYRCPASGKYSLKLGVDLLNTTGRPVTAVIDLIYRDNALNDVIILSTTTVTLPNVTAEILIQTEVDCLQGNDLYPVITFTNNSGVDPEDVESNVVFDVFDIQDTVISYGNLFECTGNMPEMSLKDFVKALVERYNLVIHSDVSAQVIELIPFREIYYNTPVDWTDKLDISSKKIDFHPEFFAQENQFKWQSEKNNPPGYADGSLLIGDTTLSKQVVSIQQPFAPSLDVKRFEGVNVMQIPLLNFDEISVTAGSAPAIAEPGEIILSNVTPLVGQGLGFNLNFNKVINVTYKVTTVKPRIGYINNAFLTGDLIYDDGATTAQASTTDPFTYFIDEDQLFNFSFQDSGTSGIVSLMDNYRELSFTLEKFKKITVPMNLKAVDAMGFDFKRPIQLHDGMYYCNKIVYTPDRLTQVELIKL